MRQRPATTIPPFDLGTRYPIPILRSVLDLTSAQVRALNATPVDFPNTARAGMIIQPLEMLVMTNISVAVDVIVGVRIRWATIAQDFISFGFWTVGLTGIKSSNLALGTVTIAGTSPAGKAIQVSSATGPPTVGTMTSRLVLTYTIIPAIAGF